MGLPVTEETARAAGVPVLDHCDLKSAHAQVGNSMMVLLFVVVEIAKFSSVRWKDVQAPATITDTCYLMC